jgi:hypothetical protein
MKFRTAFLLCAALFIAVQAWPAERWSAVISPDNSLEFTFVKDQAPVCRLGLGGWGPNWQWVGLTPPPGAQGERILTTVPFVVNQARGDVIEIGFQAAKTGPRQVAFSYRLSATNDVPITMLIASLSIDKAFGRGQLRLTHAGGQKSERPLPFGRGTVPATSNLAAKNIEPQTNPWFFSDAHLPGQTGGVRQRLLDSAAWLHETQNKFYSRFVKAIRNTGYQGPLCGSPWQAPAMLPHYYNLQSDALVGYIDRHNYFGGGLFDSM